MIQTFHVPFRGAIYLNMIIFFARVAAANEPDEVFGNAPTHVNWLEVELLLQRQELRRAIDFFSIVQVSPDGGSNTGKPAGWPSPKNLASKSSSGRGPLSSVGSIT